MDRQEAIHFFWSQFATAYEENSVEDDADLKTGYITYQKVISDFEDPVFPEATIWTRSKSWLTADTILNNIADFLGEGGQIIKINEGRLWVVKGSPFAQEYTENDDTDIKAYRLNVSMEFMTK